LDINLQPQRSSSNKLDLEWIQEYIKCKIKLSLILVLHLNAVHIKLCEILTPFTTATTPLGNLGSAAQVERLTESNIKKTNTFFSI
jgi:hypothetical protein